VWNVLFKHESPRKLNMRKRKREKRKEREGRAGTRALISRREERRQTKETSRTNERKGEPGRDRKELSEISNRLASAEPETRFQDKGPQLIMGKNVLAVCIMTKYNNGTGQQEYM
jgi:hypothetical protein